MNCFLLTLYCIFLSSMAWAGPSGAKEDCPEELTGHVVLPGDMQYNKARLVSNYYPSMNSRPKAIVYCQNVQDVQNAVKWAHCHHLPVRIRSGGHNHEGFSTGTGALVIDVSEMKKVQIDKEKGLATVEPGVTGGELYHTLFQEGLTQVGGTCEGVGISGLVLTGGMGPLARIRGLTCDNMVSFEMVDAQGRVIQATADNEHKDLFWAACGGGAGNFGVLTSIVLKVYPVKQVTWFNIGWNWNQPIEKVIAEWQKFFLKEDRRWFSHLDLWAKAYPSKEFSKQPVKVLGVFYGTPEQAEKELAPLLSIGKPSDQTIELVDWDKAIKFFEDSTSTFITDKPEYKSTGAFVMKPFPPEAIKEIVTTLQQSKTPLLNILFLCLGGAVKERSPKDTAFYYRDAKFFASYSTQWLEQEDAAPQLKEVDALRRRLQPYTVGDYVGNPDRTLKNYLTDYYGENVKKLECVKKRYDPDNLFSFEQGVPPAAKDANCL